MSPLVPDRVCELSVECCFLRNDISDKSYQNDQLQSTVNRMKTAVKRGSGTLQATKDLNKALETENAKLVAELMTVKKKLLKAESNVSFQAKVIGNNRKVIEKLKAPAGSGGKFCKNVAQLLKENVDLNEQVERLTEEVAFEKAGNVEKQVIYSSTKLNSYCCPCLVSFCLQLKIFSFWQLLSLNFCRAVRINIPGYFNNIITLLPSCTLIAGTTDQT